MKTMMTTTQRLMSAEDVKISSEPKEDDRFLENSSNFSSSVPGSSCTIDVEHTSGVGLTLSWNNLRVSLPERRVGVVPCLRKVVPGKTIIKEATGVVKPGTVMAILGGSGSGKTTLLNSLTRRDLGNLQVEGDVLLNGHNQGDDINFFSGYVQQEDVFVGTLTVREHLWFTAMLRMGKNYTVQEREKRINDVMTELSLHKCENTLIGVAGGKKGISGGEKKRLAFASELLRNPMLLFADEPTSGLDAFTAQTVVKCLLKMAKKGRTILCTIHQPSSTVYSLFPMVMYLTEGEVAYCGPNKGLFEFFAGAGYFCPKDFNPADYVIQTLAVVPGDEEASRAKNQGIVKYYNVSPEKDNILEQLDEIDTNDVARKLVIQMSASGQAEQIGEYKATFGTQFYWLFWRSFRPYRRSLFSWAGCLGLYVYAFLLGLLYFQSPYNQLGLSNINSGFLMVITYLCFSTALLVATDLGGDFPNYRKEMKSKTYRLIAYYMAKVLHLMPYLFVGAVGYATIIYWLEGLYRDAGSFFIFVATVVLLNLNMAAVGHFAGALSRRPEVSTSIASSLVGLFLTFSGALVRDSSLLVALQWIASISPINYAYIAFVTNQWRLVDFIECGPIDEDGDPPPACFDDGLEFLRSLNYTPEFLPFCLIYMVVIFVVLEIIAFFFLWRKTKNL